MNNDCIRLDRAGCTLVGVVVVATAISGGGDAVVYWLLYSALRSSISSNIRRSVTRLTMDESRSVVTVG